MITLAYESHENVHYYYSIIYFSKIAKICGPSSEVGILYIHVPGGAKVG